MDPLERVYCPLCGREFTWEHVVWDYPIVNLRSERILGDVLEEGGKDWGSSDILF